LPCADPIISTKEKRNTTQLRLKRGEKGGRNRRDVHIIKEKEATDRNIISNYFHLLWRAEGKRTVASKLDQRYGTRKRRKKMAANLCFN